MNLRLLTSNLEAIQARVERAAERSGRDPSSIRIIAVSKTRSVEEIERLYLLGIRDFGENYLQELVPKIEILESKGIHLCWHFIGQLQSNKVRQLPPQVQWIHGLDRMSAAKQVLTRGTKSKCLLQVNIAQEDQKAGLEPESVLKTLETLDTQLALPIYGLMVFPPFSEDIGQTRGFFKQARTLFEDARNLSWKHHKIEQLSMGVSSDFEIAIEEGATMIRVGESIFGKRS
ncbi:MAG: YggS family pyridoxal phosphate-dependent enzyme [Bdellovibrionales bacterium]|nr:YggS family pyridoxal phosphate-dependent enzyme [Bdellovibrionales bacterium]